MRHNRDAQEPMHSTQQALDCKSVTSSYGSSPSRPGGLRDCQLVQYYSSANGPTVINHSRRGSVQKCIRFLRCCPKLLRCPAAELDSPKRRMNSRQLAHSGPNPAQPSINFSKSEQRQRHCLTTCLVRTATAVHRGRLRHHADT